MGFRGQRETPAEWRDRERRERNCAASQGTLIRWRFRRHRAAMIGAAVLLTMAFPGLFADSSHLWAHGTQSRRQRLRAAALRAWHADRT